MPELKTVAIMPIKEIDELIEKTKELRNLLEQVKQILCEISLKP